MRAANKRTPRKQPDNVVPIGDDQSEIIEPVAGDFDALPDGVTDPADFVGTADSGTASGEPGRRKRGRPAGSRNKSAGGRAPSAKRSVQPSIDGLTEILLALHGGISALTKIDAFEIDRDEAHKLAKATERVASFYNIKPPVEAMIWAQFATACVHVYGPRVAAVGLELQERRAAKRARRVGGDAQSNDTLEGFAPA